MPCGILIKLEDLAENEESEVLNYPRIWHIAKEKPINKASKKEFAWDNFQVPERIITFSTLEIFYAFSCKFTIASAVVPLSLSPD